MSNGTSTGSVGASFMDDEDTTTSSAADQTLDLIGDGSQPYALPTLKVRQDRFKRIDAATLVKLIDGHYSDSIASFTIVDCRYPYEYNGGHIVHSLNIHTPADLIKSFLDNKSPKSSGNGSINNILNTNSPTSILSSGISMHNTSSSMNTSIVNSINNTSGCSSASDVMARANRHIIIFHCEFSSERGPRLMRLLREKDRQLNPYPELLHPELYLLEGGYKEFFRKYKEYCVPQTYRPMKCRNHRDELRTYRRRKRAPHVSRRKENRSPDISFEG